MNKFFPLALSLFSPLVFATQPAERVISLAPSATELAFSAGLGDKLIAISEMSDYPEQVKGMETVSNYKGLKLERIMALQPDLIIAWPSGNPAKELEKLEQFGFEVYYSESKTLEDIAYNIEQLSKYSEDPTVGKQAAKDFRQGLENFKSKYDTETKIRYFYQLSEKPIITVGQDNWPSEVFSFCGGENIFENANAPYPQVGIEQVITRQPDVMFMSPHAMSGQGIWANWIEDVPALSNQHVWSLNSDWLNRPTTRTLKAVEQVCDYLQTVRQKS